MESYRKDINDIHSTYCSALGYDVPLFPNMETQWSIAIKYGMTPECVQMVVRDRQIRIRQGVRHKECLLFRNIAGSEESIAAVIQEAAALQAIARVKVCPKPKLTVLQATGRPDPTKEEPVRHISEVIEAMRKAAS